MSPEPNTCQEGYHWVHEYYRGTRMVRVSGYLHGDAGDYAYSQVGDVFVSGHWAKNPVRRHEVPA